MFKVAVIAGTPVDTQMGVDYIEKKNSEYELPVAYPVYMPVSGSCDEQLVFQYSCRYIATLYDNPFRSIPLQYQQMNLKICLLPLKVPSLCKFAQALTESTAG